MRSDLVIINSELVETARKRNALSRTGLYEAVGVFPQTGDKFFTGKPVTLRVAQRVADWMGVKLQRLIKGWADEERKSNGEESSEEKTGSEG